jgi:predicted acylesterase/phospholipase RssA
MSEAKDRDVSRSSEKNLPIVRVLALDGGGILCVLALHVLAHIERICNRPICDLFDVVSGVSSGGLVALALMMPSQADSSKSCDVGFVKASHGRSGAPSNEARCLSGNKDFSKPWWAVSGRSIHACQGRQLGNVPSDLGYRAERCSWGCLCCRSPGKQPAHSALDLLTLGKYHGSHIFQKTWTSQLIARLPLGERLYRLNRCVYSPDGGVSLFRKIFGQARLSDTLRPLLIPTYNLMPRPGQEPHMKLFVWPKVSRPGPDVLMADLAWATCAVPTFFPPHTLSVLDQPTDHARSYVLVDGGVGMNAPGLAAYTYARRLHPGAQIRLLSLGVSRDSQGYLDVIRKKAPGLRDWFQKIQNLIVHPTTSATHYILKHLARDDTARLAFLRMCPALDDRLGDFDDTSAQHMRAIEAVAEGMLNRYRPALEDFFSD